MLPASGYVVIAFVADNPGAWLCHCREFFSPSPFSFVLSFLLGAMDQTETKS